MYSRRVIPFIFAIRCSAMPGYASEEPQFSARRISVIPVEPGTKQPARGLKNWTGYCDNLASPETRERWRQQYPNHGLAVCLGTRITPTHRIAAVDIDNDVYVRAIVAILGGCPSGKRGKKGLTVFVRVTRMKSTQIKDAEGRVAVDLLVSGKMTVYDGIHPETGLPYAVVNEHLASVDFDALPELDDQKFDLIRVVATSPETQELISGSGTHDAGLRLVAKLMNAGASDEVIRNVIHGLVPESYTGNSLDELPEWIRSARAKGFDKPTSRARSPKKQSQSDQLIKLVDQSGAQLFHDELKRPYMTVQTQNGGYRHLPIKSSEGGLWLSKLFYDQAEKALTQHARDTAINALEARALFAGPKFKTFQRIGRHGDSLIVDLGRDDGQLVVISAGGWSLANLADVKMIRSPAMRELPIPTRGENALRKLQSLLSLGEESWKLVLAFLLGCLRAEGPYMCLLIEGEQGSGKSFLASAIKSIIDPNQAERSRLPDNDRDLMIHAQDFFLLVFDNVSGMKGDMSDALCMLATGSAVAVRRLYTDGELAIFKYVRPFIINGIADFVQRPDLLERSIVLKLPSIASQGRRTEEELLAELMTILPDVLGALYSAAATGLRNLPTTRSRSLLRMADSERWFFATEEAAGQPSGSLVAAIKDIQDDASADRAHNDVVVARLRDVINTGPFEGTMQDLFERIRSGDPHDRLMPKTPGHLSKHLARMKPAMAQAGIYLEIGEKRKQGRMVRAWRDGQEDQPDPRPRV
jgi:hypothetical protein